MKHIQNVPISFARTVMMSARDDCRGYSKKRMVTVITVEKNLLGVIMEIQMEKLVGRLITVFQLVREVLTI
jgi:hypothetical protein